MTRILLSLCLAAGLVAAAVLPGAAQDGRDLARISAYLNAMRTAEGSFVQIAPNGETSDGRFYISRPGRIRFEYTPPNPTLVVSDGTWVAVFDLRSCNQQTAPLSQTPLELLLRDRIDLRKEGAVTGIERRPGQMRVTAVNPNDRNQGSITMIFSENPLELRQWIVQDAQGQVTTVALSEVKLNGPVDIKNFLPQLISDECRDDRRRGVQR